MIAELVLFAAMAAPGQQVIEIPRYTLLGNMLCGPRGYVIINPPQAPVIPQAIPQPPVVPQVPQVPVAPIGMNFHYHFQGETPSNGGGDENETELLMRLLSVLQFLKESDKEIPLPTPDPGNTDEKVILELLRQLLEQKGVQPSLPVQPQNIIIPQVPVSPR